MTKATGKGGELAWCPQKNLPTLQDLPNAGLWGHLREILGHISAPVTVSLGLGVFLIGVLDMAAGQPAGSVLCSPGRCLPSQSPESVL